MNKLQKYKKMTLEDLLLKISIGEIKDGKYLYVCDFTHYGFERFFGFTYDSHNPKDMKLLITKLKEEFLLTSEARIYDSYESYINPIQYDKKLQKKIRRIIKMLDKLSILCECYTYCDIKKDIEKCKNELGGYKND